MKTFLRNQTFRSYLHTKMNLINDENTSVEIGYVIRQLSQFIKEKSKDQHQPMGEHKAKQYKKVIRWKADDLKYLKKDSIYYLNTFHNFKKA